MAYVLVIINLLNHDFFRCKNDWLLVMYVFGSSNGSERKNESAHAYPINFLVGDRKYK